MFPSKSKSSKQNSKSLSKSNKSSHKNTKPSSHSQDGVTIIAEGCNFQGKLYCRGVSRIGGKVDGEIIAEGTLIIEKDANILADIQAHNVVVHGKVNGTIYAHTKVELFQTALMDGDIVTPSIYVEEGTTMNASVSMDTSKLPEFNSEAQREKPSKGEEEEEEILGDMIESNSKIEVLNRHSKFRKKRG